MSDYIKSTNFTIKDSLTSGDASKRIRGSEIDAEFNNIATATNSKADKSSPNFTGSPTATTAATGDSSSRIATTAFVATALTVLLPTGSIIMWAGSIASIPSGWYLCNGSNGTPDLRDRFVVGAGTSYAVAGTGGSKDAVVVSHTHAITDPGHTHTSTLAIASDSGGNSNYAGGTNTSVGTKATGSNTTGISVNSTGVSGTDANLPPYYALAYIYKA